MATRSVKVLSRDGIVELATRTGAGRALATVLIPLPAGTDPEASSLAVACVVYARQGGFMVVVPQSDVIQAAFIAWGEEVGSEPAFHHGVAELETNRGRALGTGEVLLIDVGWEFAEYFSPSSAFKGSGLSATKAIQFEHDGVLARPSKASVMGLADSWISSNMPDAAAQDYMTGEDVEDAELLADGGPELAAPAAKAGPAASSEMAMLHRRVQELEAALKQRDPPPAIAPGLGSASLAATAKAPPLFGNVTTPPPMSSTDWARLQRLAGPAPRMGAAEQSLPTMPATAREATVPNSSRLLLAWPTAQASAIIKAR